MQALDTDWTDIEKNVAQTAFNRAYERELTGLMQAVREGSNQIEKPDDLWRLHDLLSAKRHEIDGKYDNRYSALMFVFAGLVKEGWLSIDELNGLDGNKIAKIVALSRM
jgi:Photoprotection regulator fluorescence recovery protein